MNSEIIIVPAAEEHFEESGKIAIAAWNGIHDAYIERIGNEIHDLIFRNWEQAKVDSVINSFKAGKGYVALVDGKVAGFITYRMDKNLGMGEILANAVSSDFRGMGIGPKMYDFILSKMREEGMKYVTVSTGLDDGHAPARRAYEKMGFKKNLPSVKYYMELE